MNECDRCGKEYEERTVFIKQGEGLEWAIRKQKYEHLCEDCGERYWSGDFPGFKDSNS